MNKEEITMYVMAFCLDQLDLTKELGTELADSDRVQATKTLQNLACGLQLMYDRMKKEHAQYAWEEP